MTNPFGGTGASSDVGTAQGKVRIEYESVGASTQLNQIQQVQHAVEKTAASMEALNKRHQNTVAETLLGGGQASSTRNQSALTSHIVNITRAVDEFKRQGGLGFDNIQLRFDTGFLREQAAHARRVVQEEFSRPINVRLNVSEHRSGGGESGGGGMGLGRMLGGLGESGGLMSGAGGALAMIGRIGGAATAAAGAIGAIGAAGYVLEKGFQRQENIDSAATKMRALGYNTAQVQSIMKSALDSVDQTAFSLDEAAQTAVQALAAGVKGGSALTDYLKDVANTAALAKMSMADMGYYFNQVATQGHLEGNQLQELQQRGVPILQYLADEYGVTQQKAQEMASAGAIDFAHFEEAVHKHVSGIATTMGGSISGAIDNLKTSIARLGAAFLAPIFGGQDGQMSNFAKGVIAVQHSIDSLAKTFQTHQKGLIDFWAIMGEGALMGGHIVIDAIDLIMHAIGDMAKLAGGTVGSFGAVFDAFGAHGVADNLRSAGEGMNAFGDNTNRAGNKLYELNHRIDAGWGALNNWRNHAKNAAGAAGGLGDAFASVPPKAISVTDALDKLNIKADQASKQFTGNIQQFHELLDAMVKANASKELIDTVTQLHQQYNDSGRSAAEYGEALDKLGDSSATADEKAQSLTKALKDMGSIPSTDSLKSFNDAVREATDYQSKLVDHLDLTGGALVAADGSIQSTSKNGSVLATTIEGITEKGRALAASGEKSPAEVWNASNRALTALLGNFGIFGAQADQIINRYLKPEKDFEIIFAAKNEPEVQRELTQLITQLDDAKASGKTQFSLHVDEVNAPQLQKVLEQLGVQWNSYDPLSKTAQVTVAPDQRAKVEQALQGIFANDPTKIPSTLDIRTTQSDILQRITGAEGVLHIPTVLDIPGVGQPGGPPGTPGQDNPPPAPPGPPPLPPGQGQTGGNIKPGDKLPDGSTYNGPGKPNTHPPITGQSLMDQLTGEALARQRNKSFLDKLNAGFPDEKKPDWAQFGQHGATVAPSQANLQNLLNKPEDQLRLLLLQSPDALGVLGPKLDEAKKQGKGFSEAFSEGIASGNTDVIRAIMELAGIAGDGLGRSPAKYGPLSGSGWTFYRGQSFTTAWAQGIASQAHSVAGASGSVASAGVMPLDDAVTGFVKDTEALVKLGQGMQGLVGQVANIGLGFAGLFNTMSGGRLFPKNYRVDPSFDARRNALGPGGAFGPGDSSGGFGSNPSVTPGSGPGGNAGMYQDSGGKWHAHDPWWEGVIQAESGGQLAPPGNPNHFGLFQFAQSTWDGIAKKVAPEWVGKNPGTAPADVQARMAQENYNQNKGNIVGQWDNPYARAHPGGTTGNIWSPQGVGAPNRVGGAAVPLPMGQVNAGLPGAGTNYDPAWMVAHGFPALFQKTGKGGEATQADIPPWMHAIADRFGLPISSHPDKTLHGNAATGSWAVDIGGPGSDPAKMEALAQFLQQNYAGDIAQLIHRSGTTDYGIAGGANVGGPRGTGTYYTTGEGYSVHGDHVHVAFARPLGGLPAPQGVSPAAPIPTAPAPGQPPATPGAPAPAPAIPAAAPGTQGWQAFSNGWKFFHSKGGGNYWLQPGQTELPIGANGEPSSDLGGMSWLSSKDGLILGKPGSTPPATPASVNASGALQIHGGVTMTGQPTGMPAPAPTTPDQQAAQPDSGGFAIPGAVSGPFGDLVAQDPLLAAAIQASQGVGGGSDPRAVVPLLQHLDSLIEDQNRIVTAAEGRNKLAGGYQPPDPAAVQAREFSTTLGGIKSGLTQQYGLQEAPSGLEQAQTMVSGMSGIASDIFQTIDAGLQAMSATQNGLDIITRGVSSTADVSKLIDDFQTYITFASKVFQTAGSITSFAGSFSGGADFGGTAAAGQALSMIGQALAAINTGIDLAQEGYQITMKYVGRFLTSWLGLPGAQDMNFLLDQKTGQLQAYSSDNPMMRSTFNTLGRQAHPGSYVDQRTQPVNNLTIYQGPGQDPRDTMNDAMFAVRSSGIGAFGYDSARPAR